MIRLLIALLFNLTMISPAYAQELGQICVLKTTVETAPSESGAFQYGSGGTYASVQIRVNKGEKKKVSPKESAIFTGLDLKGVHTVSIYTYDGKSRLTSFKTRFEAESTKKCMKRKVTYGTWSIESAGAGCPCP